jgi:large subunit ribosomal protein L29
MTGTETKKLRDEELKSELASLRSKLFDLRNQTVTEKVENTSQFGKIRKDIARLLTEQRSRRSAATK